MAENTDDASEIDYPTEVNRADLAMFEGPVPEHVAFDRLYRTADGTVVGETWDGEACIEVLFGEGGPLRAAYLQNPSSVDPADTVLWEREDGEP